MYWFLFGALFVVGCFLALAGIVYVEGEMMQEEDETTGPLPSANRSTEVNMVDDLT